MVQTPFKLVHGKEELLPMEYIVLSFHIVEMTGINDEASLEEHLAQLMQLEEDCFVT